MKLNKNISNYFKLSFIQDDSFSSLIYSFIFLFKKEFIKGNCFFVEDFEIMDMIIRMVLTLIVIL